MKYKVGDKVRIKSKDWYEKNKDEDGDIRLSQRYFNEDMCMYCGKIATIEEISTYHGYIRYQIDIDNCHFFWDDEMFEEDFDFKQLEVGETFSIEGKTYRVDEKSECKECAFFRDLCGYKSVPHCSLGMREDKKDVIFTKLKNKKSLKMKTIEVTEKEVKAAFDVAKSEEMKQVLAALFCKEENNKPNLDDYKTIKSYEDACEVLGEEPILNETTRMMYNNLENLIGEFPKHIIAHMKLETISRALWGKDFQPKPDAEGSTWYYYPWFALYTKKEIEGMTEKDKGALLSAYAGDGASAGFGALHAGCRSSYAIAHHGFRLCQETEEKAIYFGRQFIELWAEYMAFNFTVGDKIIK